MSDSLAKFSFRALWRLVKLRSRNIRCQFRKSYVIVIHTPKCGGSALDHWLKQQRFKEYVPLGHVEYRSYLGRLSSIRPPDRRVGLVRSPLSWYSSYLSYLQRYEFPDNHPISILSDNGVITLKQMVRRQLDIDFLVRACDEFPEENCYGRRHSDILPFMIRTQQSFYAWTLLYHYSPLPSSAFVTASDVLSELTLLFQEVTWIRQEHLASEAASIFHLDASVMETVNASRRRQTFPLGLEDLTSSDRLIQSFFYARVKPDHESGGEF